jgi:hypothetical protein
VHEVVGRGNVLIIVSHPADRAPPDGLGSQDLARALPAAGIEACGRLIKQQDRGVAGDPCPPESAWIDRPASSVSPTRASALSVADFTTRRALRRPQVPIATVSRTVSGSP